MEPAVIHRSIESLSTAMLAQGHVSSLNMVQHLIEDGGYETPQHWLSMGWSHVQQQQWRHPLYWRAEHDGWSTFTTSGRQALQLTAPVCHVSYFEADAYARWANARLQTEAEWELAC